MVVSRFQIGLFLESHLLKSGQILNLTPSLHFLGSPFLTCNVTALSIAIGFSGFAFAAPNNLFMAQHILRTTLSSFIKLGILQFVERECQPLNVNVDC